VDGDQTFAQAIIDDFREFKEIGMKTAELEKFKQVLALH
jgi:hypothetical protein